jgi:ATP-dependent RNA helicase DDX55/SPB4
VFRADDLDLAAVARAFALLRLPRVRELAGKTIAFAESPVDTSLIPFLDKHREKARLKLMGERKHEAEKARASGGSGGKASATLKDKLKVLAAKKAAEEAGQKVKRKRKGKNARMLDEWERFGVEERLAKKVKKGKMTWDEFDAAVRGAGVHSEAEESSDDGE